MAHFAQLKEQTDPTGFTNDTHLVVTYVTVVYNKHVPSDKHIDGETWCKNFFGQDTEWKQTSYHHNFRKQYAGIGYTYDAAKDKFIAPQPYASWSKDANDDWQAPVTYPTITTYGEGEELRAYLISWDDPNLRWTAQDKKSPQNSFNWDPSALAWVPA